MRMCVPTEGAPARARRCVAAPARRVPNPWRPRPRPQSALRHHASCKGAAVDAPAVLRAYQQLADAAQAGSVPAWLPALMRGREPLLLARRGGALEFAAPSAGSVFLPDDPALVELFGGDRVAFLAVPPAALPQLRPLLALAQPPLPSAVASVEREVTGGGGEGRRDDDWATLLRGCVPHAARLLHARSFELFKRLADGGWLERLWRGLEAVDRPGLRVLTRLGGVEKASDALAAATLEGAAGGAASARPLLLFDSARVLGGDGGGGDGEGEGDADDTEYALLLELPKEFAALWWLCAGAAAGGGGGAGDALGDAFASDLARVCEAEARDMRAGGKYGGRRVERLLESLKCPPLPAELAPWPTAAVAAGGGAGSDAPAVSAWGPADVEEIARRLEGQRAARPAPPPTPELLQVRGHAARG